MAAAQETGEKIQDKLLHELTLKKGTLRIFEREGEQYVFDWERKKDGSEPPRPRMVDVMIGKFLCNLDNQTGEIARQLYGACAEFSLVDLEKRREAKNKIENLGAQLLPHLIASGELREFKRPRHAINMVNNYRVDQTIWQISSSPREREQLSNLGGV